MRKTSAKRAQLAILSVVFIVIVFIGLWAFFLGPQLAFWGQRAVTVHGLTGVYAWVLVNLNFFVAFFLLLFIVWVGYTGQK